MLMVEDRRISVDHLIPLVDVKRALAVSWPFLIDLIHDGKLPVCDITGRAVHKHQVGEHSRGLRVSESSLNQFIDSIRVR